jgi:hypothetical protein
MCRTHKFILVSTTKDSLPLSTQSNCERIENRVMIGQRNKDIENRIKLAFISFQS